jgi:hypothetical protein
MLLTPARSSGCSRARGSAAVALKLLPLLPFTAPNAAAAAAAAGGLVPPPATAATPSSVPLAGLPACLVPPPTPAAAGGFAAGPPAAAPGPTPGACCFRGCCPASCGASCCRCWATRFRYTLANSSARLGPKCIRSIRYCCPSKNLSPICREWRSGGGAGPAGRLPRASCARRAWRRPAAQDRARGLRPAQHSTAATPRGQAEPAPPTYHIPAPATNSTSLASCHAMPGHARPRQLSAPGSSPPPQSPARAPQPCRRRSAGSRSISCTGRASRPALWWGCGAAAATCGRPRRGWQGRPAR